MQKMLDACVHVSDMLHMEFNIGKSHLVRVGPNFRSLSAPINLNGVAFAWVDKAAYLGVVLKSGSRFTLDLSNARSKFFRALNAIFFKARGHKDDMLLVKICTLICTPIVTFCTRSARATC